MAMAPHWLDEVFEDQHRVQDDFFRHPRARFAFQAALAAFAEQAESNRVHPGAVGGVPAQAARCKFLEILNDDRSE